MMLMSMNIWNSKTDLNEHIGFSFILSMLHNSLAANKYKRETLAVQNVWKY